jgi:multiple sugar transport system substrate-binding protein
MGKIGALVTALLCGLLASCGQSVSRSDRIDLVLWKNQAGLDEEAETKVLIDRFNAGQHTWRVTAQSLPQGGYDQSIVAASLAGRMPCILAVDSPMVASYAWAGHLRPLDDRVSPSLLVTSQYVV